MEFSHYIYKCLILLGLSNQKCPKAPPSQISGYATVAHCDCITIWFYISASVLTTSFPRRRIGLEYVQRVHREGPRLQREGVLRVHTHARGQQLFQRRMCQKSRPFHSWNVFFFKWSSFLVQLPKVFELKLTFRSTSVTSWRCGLSTRGSPTTSATRSTCTAPTSTSLQWRGTLSTAHTRVRPRFKVTYETTIWRACNSLN